MPMRLEPHGLLIESDRSSWLAADGTFVTGGATRLPPRDPAVLHRTQLRYHRLLAERAEADFARLEAAASGRAVPVKWTADHVVLYGPPPVGTAAALSTIRAFAEDARGALDRLIAEGEPATIPAWRR